MAFRVVIEGIDGSGKGTQAAQLREWLANAGVSVTLLSFPRYEATTFGRQVGAFLNGQFGRLDEVHPLLVSLLYAGDRFESRSVIESADNDHQVVIFDRFVASNMAHQGAKLTGANRRELLDWIEKLEFEIYALPRPHLTVLLDLPADQAQQLVLKKSARSYTDRATDLQESDTNYLANVREVYRELAEQDSTWQVVPCLDAGRLRSIEEIADAIQAVVEDRRSSSAS